MGVIARVLRRNITFSSIDEWSGTGAAVPAVVLETINEHITKLVITGVPDGVSIVGATYIGHTADGTPAAGEVGDPTNIWVFEQNGADFENLFNIDVDGDGKADLLTATVHNFQSLLSLEENSRLRQITTSPSVPTVKIREHRKRL